ncbi:hypothetical protein J3B01_004155 [Coemansia erecta]|nr:hypothetical protein J3B01_004155 [Coemansia erecta]
MSEKAATQTGFWPRLFRRVSDERPFRRVSNERSARRVSNERGTAEEQRWAPRPHANSSASAATAVSGVHQVSEDKPVKASTDTAYTVDIPKQRKLQRRQTVNKRAVEQFPAPLDIMHEESGQHFGAKHAESTHARIKPVAGQQSPAGDRGARVYSARPLGIAVAPDSHEDHEFWHTHDMRIGQGGEQAKPREILDSMVDDALSSGQMRGWRTEPGEGTFNDVLGISALHPIILAFLRAYSEQAVVCLGPEHVWLAVLQGLGGVMRGRQGCEQQKQTGADMEQGALDSPVTGTHPESEDSDAAVDLAALWNVLRESSDVPRSCVSRASGHEVRLFSDNIHGRHTLHSGRGAAPLAMAAAAAGQRRNSVDYGHIEIGKRLVSWQPHRRSTNPKWMQEMCMRRAGIRNMTLTGTLQAWSGLCVLARQLKETFTGRFGRETDWWLHRVHLLACDLADYYAAQEETQGELPVAWRNWLSLALFDGHSGAPRGTRLDGWLVALFAQNAHGEPVHERHRWWIEWDCVPSGIDLLRAQSPDGSMMNMYSGFVGVQQLRRSTHARTDQDPSHKVDPSHTVEARTRNPSGTLLGEDLEAAFGLRDGASTLTGSQEQMVVDALTGCDFAHTELDSVPSKSKPLPAIPAPVAPKAIAPLIGWAVDG